MRLQEMFHHSSMLPDVVRHRWREFHSNVNEKMSIEMFKPKEDHLNSHFNHKITFLYKWESQIVCKYWFRWFGLLQRYFSVYFSIYSIFSWPTEGITASIEDHWNHKLLFCRGRKNKPWIQFSMLWWKPQHSSPEVILLTKVHACLWYYLQSSLKHWKCNQSETEILS